ncbi:MAG: hypothetical protein Q8M16_16125 [Pirellulaceae bacterium]|nr:hypothetical protein [Pirellulaceae bacterium]
MIEKATETFWKNLAGLGFIDSVQISRWREIASAPGATWLQLCHAIQQDSRLTSSHLQLLTCEHPATPVLVGNLLIQRPILHRLNWEAYDAVHVKLEKQWRVVLLPDVIDGQASTSVLSRARKIARLDDPHVTRIVDLETFGSRFAMVLPVARGERLSQIWGTPQTDVDWERVATQLFATLRRVHQAGFDVGSLDPMIVHFDRDRQEALIDDLVSSPWNNDELLPNGLSTGEEAVVVSYRAHCARFLNAQNQTRADSTGADSTGTDSTGAGRDWLEFAAWLDFVADQWQYANRSAISANREGLTRRFKQAAIELAAIHQGTDADLSQWCVRWFESGVASVDSFDSAKGIAPGSDAWESVPRTRGTATTDSDEEPVIELAEEAIELNANDSAASAFPNMVVAASKSKAGDLTSFESGPSQAPNEKPKPGTVANKQATKREVEKRRKVVMAIAIITPLPICLLVLLVMSLLQSSEDGLPDLANQSSNQAELPDVELPDVDLSSKPNTGSSLSKLADNLNSVTPPTRTGPNTPTKNTPTKASPIETEDDELLADLTPPPNSDVAMNLVEPPKTLTNAATTPSLETNSVPAPASASATEPEDDGFIAYTHVPIELDVVGAWREVLRADSTSTTTQTVQLGQLNRLTAKRTLIDINSTEPTIVSGFRFVTMSAEDQAIVQQWQLQRLTGGEPKPLALVQTTTDGQLQMVLQPAAESDWDNAENLRIELYFGERDVSHWLALGKGSRPTFAAAGNVSTKAGSPIPTDSNSSSGIPSTNPNSNPDPSANDTKVADAAASETPIPDLTFDAKSAASKGWFKETPGFPRDGIEWRFQLAGKPLRKLEKEHPLWKALRVRAKEDVYFMDEILDTGSVVLMVTAESGKKTRLEGRLQLLTPNELRPLKKDCAADAAVEAEQFKQVLKLQFDQLKSTRAKPGEGDRKQAELNRLEALLIDMDRYKKALEFVVANNDSLLEKGLAFGLVQVVDGQEQVLLKSQSYTTVDSVEK